MASSRRTYDTDVITLRTVFAKNALNSNIPALRTLTADGTGGTYWAVPSSLGGIPAFNEIITSAGTYTADLSYNRFRLLAGEGIGMFNGPAGSNQTSLYAKAFNTVDVSGNNAFYAFSNATLTPTIKFAATGAIQVRSDPTTNTVFVDGPVSNPYIVSTGQYGFYQVKVTPQASTITSSLQGWSGDFITANSPSTLLRMIGYNDIELSTNITTNSIFFKISTFTSQGYLDTSTIAATAYPNSISTVSSLYTLKSIFDSTIVSLSSVGGFAFSSVVSSINALAISTGSNFYTLTGLINEKADITQLLYEINVVNSNIKSTVTGLGSAGYLSTIGAGGGDVTTSQLASTITGLGSTGYLSSLSLQSSLTSTVTGLGSIHYISTPSLQSTVIGLGSAGYISSLSLQSSFRSTVEGLGSAGYISSLSFQSSLLSTVGGLGSAGYISSLSLYSTVQGLGSASYISSLSLTSSLLSTTNSFNVGISSFSTALGPGGTNIETFKSSITGLGSSGYVSTLTLDSALISTTNEVTLGFVSTTQQTEAAFASTVFALPSLRFGDSTGPSAFIGTTTTNSFSQMLLPSNYTWTGACGLSPFSNYRVAVSWSATDIQGNIAWYFSLSNATQNVDYLGTIYRSTFPHVVSNVNLAGTYYSGGSYTDVFKQMDFNYENIFTPQLHMQTPTSTYTPVGNIYFTIEPLLSNF